MSFFIGEYEHGDSGEVKRDTPNECIICGSNRCKSWEDFWRKLAIKACVKLFKDKKLVDNEQNLV